MKVRQHRFEGRGLIFAALFCAIAVALVVCSSPCSLRQGNGSAEKPGSVPLVPETLVGEPVSAPEPRWQDEPNDPAGLLIVAESEEWLLSIASPLASKLRHGKEVPILVSLSAKPMKETLELVKRLSSCRSVVLSCSPEPASTRDIEGLRPGVFSTSSNPTQAGAKVAEAFWGKSNDVVVACADDPEAVILGSMLAANLGVPFIPAGNFEDRKVLSACLARLGVQRVLAATANGTADPSLAEAVEGDVDFLDCPAIYRLVLQRIGEKNVRNIVLARTPRGPPDVGKTSWLAPYSGLLRGAPVVLCDSFDGEKAEQEVLAFVHEYGLRPRTVTILADYGSVGVVEMRDLSALGDYELSVEPCSRPGEGGASAFGVGRIPSRSLEEASVLIARGIARDRLFGAMPAGVLLVANPKTDYSSLPLCETISRATAEEFKNLGVETGEFYGKPSGDPEILDAARNADLIIYEGHISDQAIFEDPLFFSDPEYTGHLDLRDDYAGDAYDDFSHGYATERMTYSGPFPAFGGEFGEPEAEPPEFSEGTHALYVPPAEESSLAEPPNVPARGKELCLDKLPLVIFQSCHSLEEPLARRVYESGGAGVIGSTTNMHSASGSAFVKAFCDGLLYRGDSVGEALRDARNYFFCLAALKAKRGHKEQAKVYRAALSFQLWGDPEVRMPLRSSGRPKLPPVSVIVRGDNDVVIRTPARRLPECGNQKYFVRMFPGSELAGLVKRLKDRPVRRLTPMYFLRLPMPGGFAARGYADLQRAGDTSPRAAFLADPLQRFLYVLYFPEKVERREGLHLRFKEAVGERRSVLGWEGVEDGENAQASIMDGGFPRPGWCDVRCDSPEGQAAPSPGAW